MHQIATKCIINVKGCWSSCQWLGLLLNNIKTFISVVEVSVLSFVRDRPMQRIRLNVMATHHITESNGISIFFTKIKIFAVSWQHFPYGTAFTVVFTSNVSLLYSRPSLQNFLRNFSPFVVSFFLIHCLVTAYYTKNKKDKIPSIKK